MTEKFKKFDLSGKVALITGGAGLLGVQHAFALAESGATVILTDLDEAAAAKAAEKVNAAFPCSTHALAMDVTRQDSILAAREAVEKKFGVVAILVNNAAIDPKVDQTGVLNTSRFEHFPVTQWDFQIAVGLTGAYLCAQVFGSRMAQSGGGVILNIASDLSVIAPDQRLYRVDGLEEDRQPVKPVTYSVIKSALVGLTKYLSAYWAEKNVRVNALSPGGVFNGQNTEFVDRLTNLIPIGRMAQADEYRAAVQFLCSDASQYMTGQNIVIDGGRSVL